jgi:hypothetical protein
MWGGVKLAAAVWRLWKRKRDSGLERWRERTNRIPARKDPRLSPKSAARTWGTRHFLKLSSAKRLRPMRAERGEIGSLWQKPLSLIAFVVTPISFVIMFIWFVITSGARDLLSLRAAAAAPIAQRFLRCATFTVIP